MMTSDCAPVRKRMRIAPIAKPIQSSPSSQSSIPMFSKNAAYIHKVLRSIDFDSNHMDCAASLRNSRTELINRIVHHVLYDNHELTIPAIEYYINLIRTHDLYYQEANPQSIEITSPSNLNTDQLNWQATNQWLFYKTLIKGIDSTEVMDSDSHRCRLQTIARFADVFHVTLFQTLSDDWTEHWFVHNSLKGQFYHTNHQTTSFTTRCQRETSRDQIQTLYQDHVQSGPNSVCNVAIHRLFVESGRTNYTLNRIKAERYQITRSVTLVRMSLFIQTVNEMHADLEKYLLVSFRLTKLRDRNELYSLLVGVNSFDHFIDTIIKHVKKFKGISRQGIINVVQISEDDVVDDRWWTIRYQSCTKPLILVQHDEEMMEFRRLYGIELLDSSDEQRTMHAINLFRSKIDEPD